jgi:uncharacterized protein
MPANFSLLIKPASYCCNLRCPRCFYLGKRALFGQGNLRMSDQVLAAMIEKFMALDLPTATFAWQGGEPTLMGLDFYQRAVDLQARFARPGRSIANALQTNGTLLNDDWAAFLHAYRFLVGLSLDGPPRLHDRSRTWPDGRGSHAETSRGLEVLKKHAVEFNALTLVSSANQDFPLEIYQHLKALGVQYQQYIECVEFDRAGKLRPGSVAPQKWGEFLCALFDEWFKADTRAVSVRLFDSILVKLLEGVANVCALGNDCRQYFVVEHNGDIYPCDFHVSPEWRLGNITRDSFAQLLDSPRFRAFGARKREWGANCRDCEFLELCAGCCPKNRGAGRPENPSALCAGWKMFYRHTLPRFRELAARIALERTGSFPFTGS